MANDRREQAKTECHEQAMTRFRVGNEDLTPVIQAARFGFEAGCEYATAEGIPQADGWVDVADGWPEEDGEDVLVTFWSGTTWLVMVAVYYGACQWSIDADVIAWQPLPAPYQRQSSEGDSK